MKGTRASTLVSRTARAGLVIDNQRNERRDTIMFVVGRASHGCFESYLYALLFDRNVYKKLILCFHECCSLDRVIYIL